MMVALNRGDEFRLHVRSALNNGVTREEIKEVLLQTAVYCGVPAANSAFHAAADVFREIDQQPTKSGRLTMRTQVGIIGAGPAGLMLAHLLQRQGIESVILEKHTRERIERRVRAGVLEQSTVDLLNETGLGERMQREGMLHHGIQLSFGGGRHHIEFSELTGRAITVYGQQEVVKDSWLRRGLCRAALSISRWKPSDCGRSTANARAFASSQTARNTSSRAISWQAATAFMAISRQAIPQDVLSVIEHSYPFAWLGILAQAPPVQDELVYAYHERGFALFSMRSPEVTRLYLQVTPDEDISSWSDDRIWNELHTRLDGGDGWRINDGSVLEKSITPMRSFVVEPMQYQRLYLVGDSAHIVPPTGAKGLNLAVADALRSCPGPGRPLSER
jgi:p-hydroxybenzoate 3-monooxygenase